MRLCDKPSKPNNNKDTHINMWVSYLQSNGVKIHHAYQTE